MNRSLLTPIHPHRGVLAPLLLSTVLVLASGNAANAAVRTGATPSPTALAPARVVTGVLTVPAGRTMTLAAGAHLKFGSNARLLVNGTLRVSGQAALAGSGWDGIVVAPHGRLVLTQATIAGAKNAITVQRGGTATLTDVRISGETSPFTVLPTGLLTLRNVTVARALQQSFVDGTLQATALDYNKGSAEGFTALQGTARITITNSRLHGDGPTTGDMLSMRKGDSLTVSNTEVTGAHCAFHIVGLRALALDHVNIHGNSYGFMMYQTSKTGTKTIANSNIMDNVDFGIDEGSQYNVNGPITVRNTYIAHNGKNLALYTHAIMVTQPATHAIVIH